MEGRNLEKCKKAHRDDGAALKELGEQVPNIVCLEADVGGIWLGAADLRSML